MSQAQSTSRDQPWPVRVIGDPRLRQRARKIIAIDDEVCRQAEELVATMFAFDGLGLAAPQVGLSRRLVALCVPSGKAANAEITPGEAFLLSRMPLALVNPEIIERDAAVAVHDEGCLSVPEIYAPVARSVRVTVRARLLDDSEFTLVCGGLLGRALQHEIDHLDGILFVDRLDAVSLGKVKSRLNRLRKAAGKDNFLRTAKP